MITTLLFAGQDTTRHQFGRTVELLAGHPGQWVLLAARPDLAAGAVDEGLRLVPTTPVTGRLATSDMEVDGVAIPAGTHLSMVLAAGNTDPEIFGPSAECCDITLAGIHHCLGRIATRRQSERRRHPRAR